MRWIGAQFSVCMLLGSRNKSANKFQNLSGFNSQKFRGFRVQTPVTLNLSAH